MTEHVPCALPLHTKTKFLWTDKIVPDGIKKKQSEFNLILIETEKIRFASQ
jgi:hypothetical protein